MKYDVTLATVASLTVTVEAGDEEAAIDAAYDRAREVSAAWLPFSDASLDLNEEWQLQEPTVKPA